MQFIFLDDSRQEKPSREGMGSLVAIGGCSIPASKVREAESRLDDLCKAAGFPPREPFKWSPGQDLWMRQNLIEEARLRFFLDVLDILRAAEATALVAVCDKTRATATNAATHEADAVNLLLERVQLHLARKASDGLVVADRPGGGAPDYERFLLECLEMRQEGAGYAVPERICINVVSSPSKFVRLLQAADIIVSCTLSRVAGERTHSPPIFDAIRPLLFADAGRVGGYGLKLHPSYVFANLYHWIGGDDTLWRLGGGYKLPLPDRPYSQDEYKSTRDLFAAG